MTQKTYIVKYNGKHLQVDLRGAHYQPITKVSGHMDIPGLGRVNTCESTGKYDKSKIDLFTTSCNFQVGTNKESVHARIRRLREREAQQLDEIDAQIKALRDHRELILSIAWERANVVTVKELSEMAEK